ncbi:hypothetical protein EOM09_08830 [bacterium]|nr:hypothetical protein [bacterium]
MTEKKIRREENIEKSRNLNLDEELTVKYHKEFTSPRENSSKSSSTHSSHANLNNSSYHNHSSTHRETNSHRHIENNTYRPSSQSKSTTSKNLKFQEELIKRGMPNPSPSSYDDLYVSMVNPDEKRRNLLLAIKNALIMQEEYDRILLIRKEKRLLISEIKKDMDVLNRTFQSLKKVVPNVKDVIPLTEKELIELENQIAELKSHIKADEEDIKTRKSLESSLIRGDLSEFRGNSNKYISKNNLGPYDNEIDYGANSKLSRIQNNLKVIESRLNKM